MIGALAILASLLADGLIFAALAEFVAAGYDAENPHAVGAWAFCVVVVAGYGLPRLLEGFEMDATKGSVIAGAVGLFLVYALVRITAQDSWALWDFTWVLDFLQSAQKTAQAGGHAITGAILLLGAWVRATLRSSDEVEMESIPRAVAIPFAVVTILVVVGATTDRSGEIARVGAAFYVLAILALAFSQLALSGATFGDVRAGGTAGILLGGTAAVAVVGLLIIGLVTTVLGPIVGPVISRTVEVVLTIVLTPFAWVLTWFFEMLFAGNNPFPNITENVVRTSEEAANPEEADQSTVSQAGAFLMRILALGIFLGVAFLLATIFVRLRRKGALRSADDRDTTVVGSLREDFGSMFRGLFSRRRGYEPGQATTEATRLYLEVLRKAETAGHTRPSGETAREFAPELQETFATPVTDDITRAFESARYGGREPDARTLEELRRRWNEEAR